jgi:hypothetical protein
LTMTQPHLDLSQVAFCAIFAAFWIKNSACV